MEGRKDTRKAQFKSIVKLVNKNGVVVEYPKYDSHATSKELVRAASKRGCPLTLANAGKIVDYVGTDLTALQNEIDKQKKSYNAFIDCSFVVFSISLIATANN